MFLGSLDQSHAGIPAIRLGSKSSPMFGSAVTVGFTSLVWTSVLFTGPSLHLGSSSVRGSNNRKTNMAPPESRDSTPARHPNTEAAEESNLKNNFMQMIENLREEIRKSFREMEEKITQKMQEIKESQKAKKIQLNSWRKQFRS
ncbi:hypothetical protein H671_6g16992 [Cricetulus griseus]|nr:hypothetical protein H671_6g16992 [Cricetulus griseus]